MPVLVLTTIGNEEAARGLARSLVEERLAACVNIVPDLRSIYRWEGAVSDEPEVLMLVKTTEEQISPLRERLQQLHPYEVPEFVVLAIAEISEAYGSWLVESVKPH
ncbi:MAG TPA: divalent-cation tolerance protein CutA [Thermoanaerobaculia bacterium]|nr:divalent-cation tolerance protein CutA [Thermoanaerobaculia bacterium]